MDSLLAKCSEQAAEITKVISTDQNAVRKKFIDELKLQMSNAIYIKKAWQQTIILLTHERLVLCWKLEIHTWIYFCVSIAHVLDSSRWEYLFTVHEIYSSTWILGEVFVWWDNWLSGSLNLNKKLWLRQSLNKVLSQTRLETGLQSRLSPVLSLVSSLKYSEFESAEILALFTGNMPHHANNWTVCLPIWLIHLHRRRFIC
jgi:hypothetical protein